MQTETRTFTQQELNSMLARERKKFEAQVADLSAQLAERDTELKTLRTQTTSLETQLHERTTERDHVRIGLEGMIAKNLEAYQALEQSYADFVEATEQRAIGQQITQALHVARVLPDAARFAQAEFVANTQVEQIAGELVAITYAGKRYEKPLEAAEAFLQAHPFFAQAILGGSGSPRSTNTPTPKRDILNEDPMKLVSEGWRETPR